MIDSATSLSVMMPSLACGSIFPGLEVPDKQVSCKGYQYKQNNNVFNSGDILSQY